MTFSIDRFTSDQPSFEIEAINSALIVRFNKPEIRNSLSIDVINGLITLMDRVGLNPISRMIFTGSGDAFASGADLREIGNLTSGTAREFAIRGQSLMKKIVDLPISTIAAVNGYCFGGGLDLALSCRRRIASPKAVFCHPGVSLGIITGWGGTQRLPRLIGEGRAMEFLLTASRLSATEAFRIGLIDSIEDDVLAAALLD